MKQTNIIVSLVVGLLILAPVPVMADESSSANYKVDQTFFGSGGELENSSANYKAKTTVGELGVGNTASANYQAYAGFNTTDEPFIEFTVTGGNIDLGVLSTSTTATTQGTFRVRAWQASGYAVTNAADPPKNDTYTMATTTGSPVASAVGTEQFGINLKANTSPTTFGADPVQLPDATFSTGQVDTAYNTANIYKYLKGDRIAYSSQSTSITEYTVSYIYNIKTSTAGGTYVFRHVLVATGTY